MSIQIKNIFVKIIRSVHNVKIWDCDGHTNWNRKREITTENLFYT